MSLIFRLRFARYPDHPLEGAEVLIHARGPRGVRCELAEDRGSYRVGAVLVLSALWVHLERVADPGP